MRDLDDLFSALAKSAFRSRFHLRPKERACLAEKTLPVVLVHGRKFVEERLRRPSRKTTAGRRRCGATRSSSPSMRRPPAAVAAWKNGIPSCAAERLTDEEIHFVLKVLARWLAEENREGVGQKNEEPRDGVAR